jgi:hypothetical protein
VLRPSTNPPKNFATISANSVATLTFALMMPRPRSSIFGAARNVIFVPTVKRYIPRTVW